MKLHIIPAGPIRTNSYLLMAPMRGEAVLVDAPDGIWALVAEVLREEKCRLTDLWLTHGHWDHTQGAAEVVREAKPRVSGHLADRPLYEHPETMRPFLGDELVIEPVIVDNWVADGDPIAAVGREFEVRHVPGHCPGSVLFHLAGEGRGGQPGLAFVGDTLFKAGMGRTDFPGGNFAVLENSIRTRIYTLPDDTVVLPGHGESTTVGEEKLSNPFVNEE